MEPQDPFPKPFTVVLPVTVPPWPGRPAESPEPQPLKGLTGAQMSRFGLHDIQLDEESQRVYAAGLDGFVGVARGTGHTFELARGLALEVALAAQLREKQLRPDVGQHMGGALAALEAAGLLL